MAPKSSNSPAASSRSTEDNPQSQAAPPHPYPTSEEPGENRPNLMIGAASHCLAAMRFLLPLGRPHATSESEKPHQTIRWIVPVGLAIGLLWAGSFRFSWWLFGETGSLRVVPSLVVVLIECLFTGALLILGLSQTGSALIEHRRLSTGPNHEAPFTPVAALLLCLIVLFQYVLILSIPATPGWWPPPDDWRHHFNFLYPQPIYRPLLLAPLWGRWGILLAATIGRTASSAEEEIISMNRQMSPGRLLRHSFIPVVLTAIYCSRSSNIFTGIIIGLIVFSITYVLVVIIARRSVSQSRQSFYASGQIAQLAFIIVYRAMWRLIDG